MDVLVRASLPLITRQCRPSISTCLRSSSMLPRPIYSTNRPIHHSSRQFAAPKSKDRGPKSTEDTQTDFGAMDVLGSMPVPTTAVDSCMENGFAFNSGLRIKGAGAMLAAGEAFAWRPWTSEGTSKVINSKGQFELGSDVWGMLDLLWPKPDLLVIGTGGSIAPLSPASRERINNMGIRVEVQDTRNAAAQFNLLATERGIQQIAAALVPVGWRDSK